MVVACHCVCCQRRTGSPFGVLAYYPEDVLTISGRASRYVREAESGSVFETFFCPNCGTTVYARAGKHPGLVGVAVGAFGDPQYPPPIRSVWEQNRHAWVALPEATHRFQQGTS